jgi:hypothetical protein
MTSVRAWTASRATHAAAYAARILTELKMEVVWFGSSTH